MTSPVRRIAGDTNRDRLADVEDLVVRGFLTQHLSVSGSIIIMKSVTPQEFREIKDWAPETITRSQLSRYNLFFLAFSIYKIDGKNILRDRPESLTYLVDQLGRWPKTLIELLTPVVLELRDRYVNSLEAVKFWFAQEASKRWWKVVKNCVVTDPRLTAIEGTQYLGINDIQSLWIGLNRSYDSREEWNMVYSSARLVASATNPKGMRSVNSAAEAMDKRLEETLNSWSRGEEVDATQGVQVARTVEDLMEQKRTEEAGIKDEHDLAVERYEEGLRRSVEERSQEIARKAEKPIRDGVKLAPGEVIGSSQSLPPEEVEAMMQKRREERQSGRTMGVPPVDESIPLDFENESVQKFFAVMNKTMESGSGEDPETLQPPERVEVKRVPGTRIREAE